MDYSRISDALDKIEKIIEDLNSHGDIPPSDAEDVDSNLSIIRECLDDMKPNYRKMCKSLVGEPINDFFCNGFFGSSTYDLAGATIFRVFDQENEIVVEVQKLNGIHEYGYFDGGSANWKIVYEYLNDWVNQNEE